MATRRTSEKPKYQVVDGKLHAQTPEGEIILPLRFKTKLIRAARDIKNGQGDELDQFFYIIDALGDFDTLAVIDELDFVEETTPLVMEFFKAFGEQQRATTGESRASSN
ncbi:hypothetical protein SCB71_06300 [Herbiconiux sp. KACC 21604]|uniref:hypothetical protein n=1 Tax=unclassified Herbiconiux TaxID=2618217 RepID=UPI001491F8DB|nr:hypothetical protein [Herbiconiux sp. SALV-R1]QJU52929.1 hypothetical protein HL652_04285 [Herbiconiux sp. SALV-R1]WPO87849.1 hypothetical protein SCB71_06300 [Herbiconiux sp. KACC 21604]